MSRIGKKAIHIPDGVKVHMMQDQIVEVAGPKGTLRHNQVPDFLEMKVAGETVTITPRHGSGGKIGARWGLLRAQVAHMIEGVYRGFEKKLELEGIGHRAQLDGATLVLQVGFTHPVRVDAPEGISFRIERNTITVSGVDKMLVGEVAARIRRIKPPEPYKGKGIRYAGEVIRRKAGKKAVAAG
ncbi:MAG: large subunit ribosomal protein L6 [Parcubacteria group bacterium Gr01-1014_66]|nr:MAG: large subunit ribosomal protein L6 [Parcubacteria group bacterium Gr01-1014_66]